MWTGYVYYLQDLSFLSSFDKCIGFKEAGLKSYVLSVKYKTLPPNNTL